MDAFKVHDQLIRDYRSFTEGFVEIRDRRIREHVEEQAAQGAQWPAPWLALNPAFAPGGRIDELVRDGLLHPECARIFRPKRTVDDEGSGPITLHQHQRDAVEVARTGASYVLTTGTGSGKSLAYIVPIVDEVLRGGSGSGIKAIVVYPVNALANSQREELAKFLTHGYGEGAEPVTFARYTGQEDDDTRQQILRNPPDILLTNYVMLELVLTRPEERRSLIRAAEGLRFLVLDELHTYRGRQGADVAMLVRRVREACAAHDTLQCIGTSATMASGDTQAEQRAEVGRVASQLFGPTVQAKHVITETLVRATATREPSTESLRRAVRARGDAESDDPDLKAGFDVLRSDPLASWAEDTFGITEEPSTGTLIRRTPRTVD
ncbi:MAG: DEAD/DEAH box helicase, partial [Pseudonocardiaceae bacterium]